MMQTLVYLLGGPAEVLGILGHLQTGGGYTTGIDSLTRSKEHAVVLEVMNSTRLASHVADLTAAPTAISLELLGILFGELVLEGARQSDIALNRPSLLACCKLAERGELVGHILHLITVRCTHDEHIIDHLRRDAVRNSYYAVRPRDSHHLGAQFDSLQCGTPCYVAKARESHRLALDILAGLMEQVLGEIECTKARCLGTQDRATPGHALAGEYARMVLASQLLVHTIEETDLTTANAYIACRDILIRTDATPEFEHKGLAETHDLGVGFAYRIKVCTTLGATHRQRGQCILKGLLKSQELKHRRRNGTVEAKTSLVRADS